MSALTVDVEDYYHLLDTPYADPATWAAIEGRTHVGMGRIRAIADRLGIRATLFVLGAEARRHPALVRSLAADGHEIASHGMWHRRVTGLSPAQFREELAESRAVLEDLAGQAVVGFRAPGYSLTPATPWAFEILAELGFLYDSSLLPVAVRDGGWPGTPGGPHLRGGVVELPLAASTLAGVTIAWGAGARLRVTPPWLVRAMWRRLHRRGLPAVVLVHPRELDDARPSLPGLTVRRRLASTVGVRSYPKRLAGLLEGFRFQTCRAIAEDWLRRDGAPSRPAS